MLLGAQRIVTVILLCGCFTGILLFIQTRRVCTALLYQAAVAGQAAQAVQLLRLSADPNAVQPQHNDTAMLAAIRRQDAAVVRVLLAACPRRDIELTAPRRTVNLVVYAAQRGDPAVLDLVHAAFPGSIPQSLLLAALKTGNVPVIRHLLSLGADPNRLDAAGRLPLQVAGTANAARALLEAGADPNATARDGNTPLHTAWRVDIVAQLLAAHARIDRRNARGETPLQCLVGRQHVKPDEYLHLFQSLTLLTASGADVRVVDAHGNTPLHGVDTVLVADHLVEHGAEVQARNDRGETPLHTAAAYGRSYAVMIYLLRKGAEVRAVDHLGRTPLHVVMASTRYPSAVDLLLEYGANINARDARGRTPLDLLLASEGDGTSAPTARLITFLRARGAVVHGRECHG